MAQAKDGDTAKVHYTGKLADGTVFDSSEGREPLEFTIGEHDVIPGFEQAVVGMNAGGSTTAQIPAAEAYGPHREDLIIELERSQFPEDLAPEVGQQLQMQQEGAEPLVVSVTAVSETHATLDANHPLAGKDLTFEIELVEIA